MADRWSNDPFRYGVALVAVTTLVFVVLGTGVFGDPLRESLVRGVGFGLLYAVVSAAYRRYR